MSNPELSPAQSFYGCPSRDVHEQLGQGFLNITARIKCAKFPETVVIKDLVSGIGDTATQTRIADRLGCQGCPNKRVNPEVAHKQQMVQSLHHKIASYCGNLFIDGHYINASLTSFIIVKDRLREVSGFERANDAVGKGRLYFNGAPSKNVDDDFQRSAQFALTSIDFARNTLAHSNLTFPSDMPEEEKLNTTFSDLMLSSRGMWLLDGAVQKPVGM